MVSLLVYLQTNKLYTFIDTNRCILNDKHRERGIHVIQNMHLYRNLGSITFESETNNFEIFSAEPQSCIVQAKSATTPHYIFQRVSSFYKQHLHGEYVRSYNEEQKGSALVISHCQRVNTYKLDAHALCQILSAVATVVENVTKIIEGWIGDIQISLIRYINGRVTFVYIPCCKVQKHEQRIKTLTTVLEIANSLKNEEDVTSRLLIKKISKCSSLADIVQEISYFASIYASRKTNPCALKFLEIKKNQKQMSIRKLGLLKMNQVMKKTRSTLYNNRNSLNMTSTRKSTSSIHIILPNKSRIRKQTSSLHSSCGSMRPSTTTKNMSSHTSGGGSDLMESRSKILMQKSIKKEKEVYTIAVSPRDQQKLLQKLKSKRASRNTPRTTQQPKQRDVSIAYEEPIITAEKYVQAQPEQVKLTGKEKLNQIPETFILKSPIVTKQQPQQKQIKLKKKAMIREQVKDDDIEVLTLDKFKTTKQPPINHQSIDGQNTYNKSWNSKQKTVPALETLENKSSIKTQQALLQKLHNLDYIGVAVVNTRTHLKNFQQIFWQLPMFFLYRQFYLKRAQLIQEMINHNPNSSQYNGLKQQNSKIEESLMKMINLVNRKQKQQDPDTLQQLKPYLNLDKKINCKAPINTFVGQYIESMSEALDNYPELLTHSVEVIDALLICKDIKINSQMRAKAMKQKDLYKYFNNQKHILAKLS